jgi:hypothetical protein
MKQADLRDMFNKVTKNVCASTTVVSPDVLFPAPSTSLIVMTPEDPNNPEPVGEGDIQVEYSSD